MPKNTEQPHARNVRLRSLPRHHQAAKNPGPIRPLPPHKIRGVPKASSANRSRWARTFEISIQGRDMSDRRTGRLNLWRRRRRPGRQCLSIPDSKPLGRKVTPSKLHATRAVRSRRPRRGRHRTSHKPAALSEANIHPLGRDRSRTRACLLSPDIQDIRPRPASPSPSSNSQATTPKAA